MSTRYSRAVHIAPIRKITPALTDILHKLAEFETLDQLSFRFYKDATLSWIIMCANPQYSLEWEIPAGAEIRIPFPLSRVWSSLGINGEL